MQCNGPNTWTQHVSGQKHRSAMTALGLDPGAAPPSAAAPSTKAPKAQPAAAATQHEPAAQKPRRQGQKDCFYFIRVGRRVRLLL